MKGQKLLKVTSILMIIGGVIAVIAGILAIMRAARMNTAMTSTCAPGGPTGTM